MPHEIVLSVATSPNFPLLTLVAFHCLLRPKRSFDGATCKLLMYPCQSVTKKSSTSATWQVMQLNNTYSWNVLELVRWSSPKKLQTVSVLSQSSRFISLHNKTTAGPASNSYSHHIATERVEEFTPLRAATSSNRASPASSCLSEHYLHYLVTWLKRHEHCRERTQHERSHTGTDYVVLRRRRARLGAAVTLVCCGSLASVHSHKRASQSRVFASCPTSPPALFFWPKSASTVVRACFQLPFDYPCTNRSDLFGLDQSSWKQPHRTTIGIPTTELGVCGCGSRICGEVSTFQSQQ